MTNELTEEEVFALKVLVEKLNKEDERAYHFYKKLKKQLNEQVAQKIIDGFNLYAQLWCTSKDAEVNKKYGLEEGDPISGNYGYSFFEDERDHFDNWNETFRWNPESELFGMHFSYAAHCVFFHSSLSYEDIHTIDNLYIDITVDYQFVLEA